MTVGRLSQLGSAATARIQAACNYINAEVAKRRRRVLKWAGVIVALAGITYWFMARAGHTDPRFPLIAATILIVGITRFVMRDLRREFKHIVVRRVVDALGNGIAYSSDSTFNRSHFNEMGLFDNSAERLRSEDQISGRKNNVAYTIHECHATYTTGSGKNRRTVTIFRGVIVRLDFNKHFAGRTIVVRDVQSKRLGGLLGESSSRRGLRLVRLESVTFEEEFSVYSTDDQEARYLLTPKLQELVLEAQSVVGTHGPLRLSFHDNSVFVTVPDPTNRFEVRLFGKPVTPESVAGDLAELVGLAGRLVDTLDLETRIWSRA